MHVRRDAVAEIMNRVIADYAPQMDVTVLSPAADFSKPKPPTADGQAILANSSYDAQEYGKASVTYGGILAHFREEMGPELLRNREHCYIWSLIPSLQFGIANWEMDRCLPHALVSADRFPAPTFRPQWVRPRNRRYD